MRTNVWYVGKNWDATLLASTYNGPALDLLIDQGRSTNDGESQSLAADSPVDGRGCAEGICVVGCCLPRRSANNTNTPNTPPPPSSVCTPSHAVVAGLEDNFYPQQLLTDNFVQVVVVVVHGEELGRGAVGALWTRGVAAMILIL
jgi:hypothetical protein